MSNKAIALATIFYFLIAIVVIFVILMLVGTKFSPALQKGLCSTLRGVRGLLPLPDYMQPTMPAYCEQNTVFIETIEIQTKNPDQIALNIAAYTQACWEKTTKLDFEQDIVCYELIINNIDGEITEEMVRANLYKQYQNIFVWKLDTLTEKATLGISYDSATKKIEVI